MENIQDTKEQLKKSFFNHVFSTTEEDKSELLNIIQYSTFGIIPIIVLNKIIQKIIPDADAEKSSLEITIEIFIQLVFMFCGIVFIHRIITYFPTYSGYKYENLVLINVILAFLVIILSIQTKMGIKVNILVDRLYDLWEGTTDKAGNNVRKNIRIKENMSSHAPSQADYLDNPAVQNNVFPTAPSTISSQTSSSNMYDNMIRTSGGGNRNSSQIDTGFAGPMAANSLIGSSFGAF
jgi:hypothetical protein